MKNTNSTTTRLLRSLRRYVKRKPVPAPLVIFYDFLALGAALLVFALFHHVIPTRQVALGLTSSRNMPVVTAAPDSAATPAPTKNATLPEMPLPSDVALAEDTQEQNGYFGVKYADKFSAGEPQYAQTESGFTYVSQNINLTFTTYTMDGLVYHVADFYIRDISVLKTALANDTYGKGQSESVPSMANRNGALLAINGDYYGHGGTGCVIRNGTLYRDKASGNDLCALFWNGTMQVYAPGEVDGATLIAQGTYQCWDFGPYYIRDGVRNSDFNSNVGRNNPRTVLGYFEPGHYCFVCIDGRSSVSSGLTNTNTAKLMESLGVTCAYNLDGGQSSVMTWQGEFINVPYRDGRNNSDIVYLSE